MIDTMSDYIISWKLPHCLWRIMDNPMKYLIKNNLVHFKPSTSKKWISFLFSIPVAQVKNPKKHGQINPPSSLFSYIIRNINITKMLSLIFSNFWIFPWSERLCLVSSSWKFCCGGNGVKMVKLFKIETEESHGDLSLSRNEVLVFPRVHTQGTRLLGR